VIRRGLGASGLELSVVGLGTSQYAQMGGPFGWGPQTDEDSLAALERAAELGVDWVDSAPVYGGGHSEALVGRALANGARLRVSTKCGVGMTSSGPRIDLSPAAIRSDLEQSLQRLGTDHVAVLHLHRVDPEVPVEETWGEIAQLIDEGKIGGGGLCRYPLELVERCHAVRPVASLMLPLSLLEREWAPQIDWAADNGVGVVVHSTLASGILSGRMTPERWASLPPDDFRSQSPEFGQRVDDAQPVLERLEAFAGDNGTTVAAAATAWAAAYPGVTAVIAGARRPSQIEELAAAVEIDPAKLQTL